MKKLLTFCGLVASLMFFISAAAWAVVIGPGELPNWHADSQVQLGWIFDDSTHPQNSSPLPGWDKAIGDIPVWNYQADRIVWGQPGQWYIRIPNLINENPVKNCWISWVYQFDPYTPGPRAFTDIDWYPLSGYKNFEQTEDWFDSEGNPTENHLDAAYARITIHLDLYPNPYLEDVWLGTAGSMMALEVYVKTLCIEACECDLNHDGRCDMQDWLLFGEDWGHTDCGTPPGSGNPPNDCKCDLNHDGRCDMQDWLLFGEDWGRTDCPIPQG